MSSSRNLGRANGVLVLLHLAVGLMIPFMLLQRLTLPPGFLETGAGMSTEVRVAVFLLFIGSAMPIAIACAGWQVFRNHSPAMALSLIVLAAASFTLQALDNAHLLTMLSLSQAYAKAAAAKLDMFQGLAVMVGPLRKWTHYSFLLVVVSWMFLLFTFLFRFRLVPRVLGALGMAATLLQIGAVPIRGFLGYPPEMRLAVPLGPVYGLLAIWLMVRGFNESRGSAPNGRR